MRFTLFVSALSLALVSAAPQAAPTPSVSPSTSASVSRTTPASMAIPFFSAPNTFTPTATGNTAIPGSVIAITNSAGAGSLANTFIYTAALSTVAPTGNVTLSATGLGASASNLIPDPKNLQTAAASSLFQSRPFSTTGIATTVLALSAGLAFGGLALFV